MDGLICSTIAAKEGLTLTAADTVVFIEREWVPGWEEQAEDRVNRIGQDSDTVWATYLSVAGTIDERFDRIVEEKRKIVGAVLDGGEVGERMGIAMALLESMVEAGEIPASMLKDMGGTKMSSWKYGYIRLKKENERLKERVAYLEIDGGSRLVNLYWYGQRHGGVCIVWGPRPPDTRVFRWGCEHKNANSRKIGIQFSKYTCADCTAVWEVDSSG